MPSIHMHHSIRFVSVLIVLLPLSLSFLLTKGGAPPLIIIVLLVLLGVAALAILGAIFYQFISVSSAVEQLGIDESTSGVKTELTRDIE